MRALRRLLAELYPEMTVSNLCCSQWQSAAERRRRHTSTQEGRVVLGCFRLETPAVRASDERGGGIHTGPGRRAYVRNASPHTRFRISVECRVALKGSNSVRGVEGVEDLRVDPSPRCHVVAVLDCPVPHCLQLLFRAT
jgi:hypothetical protein